MKRLMRLYLTLFFIVLGASVASAQTIKMELIPEQKSKLKASATTIILNDSLVVMNDRVFECDFKIGTYVSSEGLLYTKREYKLPGSKNIVWFEITRKDKPYDYVLIDNKYYSIAYKSFGVDENELYNTFITRN